MGGTAGVGAQEVMTILRKNNFKYAQRKFIVYVPAELQKNTQLLGYKFVYNCN